MDVLRTLALEGHRLTKARKEIVNLFQSQHKPLSALEVKQILTKRNVHVNRTTVYRELWFLKEKGILQEISFGEGKSRFEIITAHCHHHLVCNNCGGIEDIIVDEDSLIQAVQKNSQFTVERHLIEFFGVCANCK